MAMTVPDLQHALLFDLEAELRRGGLIRLLSHICDAWVRTADEPSDLSRARSAFAGGGPLTKIGRATRYACNPL
jgi:hypothetical protein